MLDNPKISPDDIWFIRVQGEIDMSKRMFYSRSIAGRLVGILLISGITIPAEADPYIGGASSCWVDGAWVNMWAGTWIGQGWYPEVQVIGHLNTITQLHAPYIQVFGPYLSPNTSIGTVLYSYFYAASIPGWYAIETLHGYIDEDETVHESGVSGWACYL